MARKARSKGRASPPAGIDGVEVDKVRASVQWISGGKSISVSVAQPEMAMGDAEHGRVLVLGAPEKGLPQVLTGFSADGTKRFEVGPPLGFQFYYLATHVDMPVCVVCMALMDIDGWSHWHFSVNESTGKLTRHNPSY